MKSNQQLPDSKHFRLQQLPNGVYAAIHIDGGGAFGNAGIIDLGDRTLIFDTFFTPQAAEDLRTAAEVLTGRPIDAVINSHFHNDHIWGNQVFSANTEIISTEETRRLFIATRGLGGNDDSFLVEAEANLEATRAQFQATEDEAQRRQLALWIDYYQSIVMAKPLLQVRAPNLTFAGRLAFHGKDRAAELIAFEGGLLRAMRFFSCHRKKSPSWAICSASSIIPGWSMAIRKDFAMVWRQSQTSLQSCLCRVMGRLGRQIASP